MNLWLTEHIKSQGWSVPGKVVSWCTFSLDKVEMLSPVGLETWLAANPEVGDE